MIVQAPNYSASPRRQPWHALPPEVANRTLCGRTVTSDWMRVTQRSLADIRPSLVCRACLLRSANAR